LPPGLAVDLVVQTARGLEAAHALGIVHRDVKPENVMIRRDGLVKVLDFGLAKLVSEESRVDAQVTGAFDTMKGQILGTVAYMSPEQARGLLVDARSDVFSLGVVFYEMLSGRPPFRGQTPMDTLAAVLNTEPASLSHVPGVGAALDRVVQRALDKDRDRRWPSAGRFGDAIREVTTSAVQGPEPSASATSQKVAPTRGRRRAGIDSLAVLPFVNASRDDELEYLGDGLTECLINNLSQIPNLRVMARGTVYLYKGPKAATPIPSRLAASSASKPSCPAASSRSRIASASPSSSWMRATDRGSGDHSSHARRRTCCLSRKRSRARSPTR
jgi:serine/threonine protein kinase